MTMAVGPLLEGEESLDIVGASMADKKKAIGSHALFSPHHEANLYLDWNVSIDVIDGY